MCWDITNVVMHFRVYVRKGSAYYTFCYTFQSTLVVRDILSVLMDWNVLVRGKSVMVFWNVMTDLTKTRISVKVLYRLELFIYGLWLSKVFTGNFRRYVKRTQECFD